MSTYCTYLLGRGVCREGGREVVVLAHSSFLLRNAPEKSVDFQCSDEARRR